MKNAPGQDAPSERSGAIATVEGPLVGHDSQFPCRLDGGEVVRVTYVTPYGGWRTGDEDSVGGGFIAIPEIGSRVLIQNVEGSYYYNGTLYTSNPSAQAEGGEDPIKMHGPSKNLGGEEYKGESAVMGYRWVPQRQVIENPTGDGLNIFNSDNEENKIQGVQLKENFGEKKITLVSSDDNNCIEMETLYHDRIKLTQDEVDNAGAQELHVETESNQNYHCETGKIWMEVTEGLDIDIINNSGGASKIPVTKLEFGNINLISRNMDINLTAEGRKHFIGNGTGPDYLDDYVLGSNVSGYNVSTSYVDENGEPINPMEGAAVPEEGGSIFIQALGEDNDNQMIQIYSKDKMLVYGKGNVWIGGDKIIIRSESTLDISAKDKISISSDTGNVAIDSGGKILLNSGNSDTVDSSDTWAEKEILEDNNLGVGKTEPGDEPIKVEWLPQPEEEEEEA